MWSRVSVKSFTVEVVTSSCLARAHVRYRGLGAARSEISEASAKTQVSVALPISRRVPLGEWGDVGALACRLRPCAVTRRKRAP